MTNAADTGEDRPRNGQANRSASYLMRLAVFFFAVFGLGGVASMRRNSSTSVIPIGLVFLCFSIAHSSW